MSTPLRVFIAISILLHITLVGFLVVPSILGLFRRVEEPLSEEQVMLMKQKAAEKVTQEAAREEIKKMLAERLKEDLRSVASDLTPAKFEQFWTNSFQAVQSNLNQTAADLAKSNLTDLSPQDLEAAMRGLREAEIDALMQQLGDLSKDEIAAQVLAGVAATLPEFNQKTRELMDQSESPKIRAEVDKLLAAERSRRQRELIAANSGLNQAQQQLELANNQSTAVGSSLAHTLGDNQKRADAAAKADATVQKALAAAADAARNTAALEKALAAKAAADEAHARSEALLKEVARHQADLEKALTGAQGALQDAATQADKGRAVDARDGLAATAKSLEKTATDAAQTAASAIRSSKPGHAAAAYSRTGSALAEAARAADEMTNLLVGATSSTNAAIAKSAVAAIKSAASATNLLEKAMASARAAGAAAQAADADRRQAVVAATAPARDRVTQAVAGARAAVDHALKTAGDENAKNAARTLRDTAAALNQVLSPTTIALEHEVGRTNLAAAAEQAAKLAAELNAAARRTGNDASALAQEARDRKSAALGQDAAALDDASQTLRDAERHAQRAADALQAAAAPAAAARDRHDEAARTDAAEAQETVRRALDNAAKELRSTSVPFTEKAEKPVAEALAAAARQTDVVLNGAVKRTADLLAGPNNTKLARQSTAATQAAISNLVAELSRTRRELSDMTGKPTADEVNIASAAHRSLDGISKIIDRAEEQLDKASAAADKGSEGAASRKIEETSKGVRDASAATLEHASDALAPKPPDNSIPESWPRPGRKEMSIAQRDMVSATNRLSALTRQVAEQKSYLAGAGLRFESNFVQTVDNALTEDPALRRQTQEFVRQTLREKVATEFREKAETLVEKVLEQKGMEKDARFVKRVGQQAADMLLAGSESNLFDTAFAEMMGQTAKEFGVKPEELRRKLAAADSKDEGDDEVTADDPAGAKDSNGNDTGGKKKKKKLKKGNGTETPGAAEGGDENGLDGVDRALDGALAKSLQSGAQSAIGRSASSSLRLPAANSFGESIHDTLRQKLAGSGMGAAMRAMSTGGREGSMAGMSDRLAKLGVSLKAGAASGRRTGMYENPEEYRRNLETVIKGREVKEVVLVAPSLTNVISAATAEIASNRPALLLVGSRRDRKAGAESNLVAATERLLVPPEFKSFAYGGAPFTTNPPTIDGDLSDWDGVHPFALRGTLKKSLWTKPFPVEWETNRYLMVQWDYTGFYFAYQMVDSDDTSDVGVQNFWEGDCLELWVDFSNRRSDDRSEDQQQFWFWPMGNRRLPGVLGGECIMPGNKLDARFRAGAAGPAEPRVATRRTTSPRGYQVEVYMPLACFRKPDFTPGRVIAFDFSIHNGEGAYLRWTTELGKAESTTPSVWGDLALLGSDADIRAVKPRQTTEALAAIIPGEPLGVRLFDPDMNTDPRVPNQVKVKFETGEGHTVIGYLQETGANTGLFEGSIDTVEVLPGEDRELAGNAIPVISGGYVEVSYYDQARRYGERNYTARKRVPVGVPVMKMAVRKP
jgi:hypothetical protein